MNKATVQSLEYDKIMERLEQYAISDKGKESVRNLRPSIDIQVIRGWMEETSEARTILDKSSNVPLNSMAGTDKIIDKLNRGQILLPGEFEVISNLLGSVKRMKRFMASMRETAPIVSTYALSMYELETLAEEIYRCIRNDMVDDKASAELYRLRRKITDADERIRQKLESILKSPVYSAYIQDALISIRNGRYAIPVKKEYRRNVEGEILDTSASGSTLFIEPAGVKRLQEELNMLKFQEENEVYRVLTSLTGMVQTFQKEILINLEAFVHYDFLFAKAKYSKAVDGNPVALNTRNCINVKGARHPLIGSSAVPLDFTIGDEYRALVITGPNTGGKTVVLKTVGLLTMMAQSGLHVPVEKGSELALFNDILADIGDGQSIEQSLSTFSSHIRNISGIIESADPYTLVIMDELGAGTDPAEGMGLAVSILEEVFEKGSTIIATTHYSEIKSYAAHKHGFKNGRMEFDINTLKPLYRLKIGEAGESNAFLIALRLGISSRVIERAHEITYKEKMDYSCLTENLNAAPLINAEVLHCHANQVQESKRIQETSHRLEREKKDSGFKIGDCVYISSMDRTGIVCELENSKGEVGVMVMKKKVKVNRKRLSLYIEGGELYPENYDFDIIFDSKENRRKRRKMEHRHVDGLVIEQNKG